jgi:hypothetical protein
MVKPAHKARYRSRRLTVALAPVEAKHFDHAAETAGLSVSAWARSRLRKAAKLEAEQMGEEIPNFELEELPKR